MTKIADKETEKKFKDLIGDVLSEINFTCQSCKYRTGTRCNKRKEYISLDDWCGSYKKEKK